MRELAPDRNRFGAHPPPPSTADTRSPSLSKHSFTPSVCSARIRTRSSYAVPFLRRREIPELRASSFNHRALGKRLAINSVVQGSAADLIKVAMVNVQRRIDRDNLPVKLLSKSTTS